ncbi:DUF805 domain-containing protein [Staphylococcus cohnii]
MYWQNAFDFKGRARRKELWFPFLVNVLISILSAILLDHIFKIPMAVSDAISALFTIIIFIPDFSVATRRMHDIGRTMTFPIIFSIFFVVFFYWLIYHIRRRNIFQYLRSRFRHWQYYFLHFKYRRILLHDY